MLTQVEQDGSSFSSGFKEFMNTNPSFQKAKRLIQGRKKYMKKYSSLLFSLQESDSSSDEDSESSVSTTRSTGTPSPHKRRKLDPKTKKSVPPSPSEPKVKESGSPSESKTKKSGSPCEPKEKKSNPPSEPKTPKTSTEVVELISPIQTTRKSKRTPTCMKKRLDVTPFKVTDSMSESVVNWKKHFGVGTMHSSMAREVLGGKPFAGPFSHYDCWSLANYEFIPDSMVYRLCLIANLMSDEKVIDVKMWVEDPIAFAQCVSLTDLTVNTRVILNRLDMMKKSGHTTWEDMMATKKTIFIPINYPAQNHWVAGNVICKSLTSHFIVINASFTSHSQVIDKSLTSH